MTKAILMTIRPEHLVKILNGDKTIEIRKTIPKCKLPIDVYLVCSKAKPYYVRAIKNGKSIPMVDGWQKSFRDEYGINGKVVCKFVLNKWEEMPFYEGYYDAIPAYEINPHDIPLKACLSIQEINQYGKGKDLYALPIDNLVIFDKPKEISDFENFNPKDNDIPEACITSSWQILHQPLTKAPQSWQYCYVKGENKQL